jgi:hypothetical protein
MNKSLQIDWTTLMGQVSHEVVTAFEKGWSTLKNGELLQAAENNDFTVLLTTDMNLRYQQNLSIRKISVVVLSTTSWPRIKSEVSAVAEAVAASTATKRACIVLVCAVQNEQACSLQT